MIRLGLRLTLGSGREAALRVLVTAAAVALGVGLMLFALAGVNGLRAQTDRGAWLNTSVRAPSSITGSSTSHQLWWLLTADQYGNQVIDRVDVAATGQGAPIPPGIAHLPAPGEFYASPALTGLFSSVPRGELRDRFPGRQVGTIGAPALPSPNSLIIVIGGDVRQLSRVPGAGEVQGFQRTASNCFNCQSGTGSGPILKWILVGGAVALLLPVLILIATASRLSAARREERFAAMRLVGATPHQVSVVSAVEATVAAIGGMAVGFALFYLFRPLLVHVPFAGAPFAPGDLALQGIDVALVVIGVPIASVVSARLALRRVQISPLGVSRRVASAPPRVVRMIPLLAGIALLAYFDAHGKPGSNDGQILELFASVVLVLVGLVLAGPWLTKVGSRLMANRSNRPATLIAGRRLLDNPKAAFRSISGLVIALFVASAAIGALSSIVALSSRGASDAATATLADSFCGVTAATDCKAATELASVPASVLAKLRATPGVRGVTVVHLSPSSGQQDGFVSCEQLATTPAIGKCAPGATVASIGYFLQPVAGNDSKSSSTVWPSAHLSVAEANLLPVDGIVVATDGSSGSLEWARTMLERVVSLSGNARSGRGDHAFCLEHHRDGPGHDRRDRGGEFDHRRLQPCSERRRRIERAQAPFQPFEACWCPHRRPAARRSARECAATPAGRRGLDRGWSGFCRALPQIPDRRHVPYPGHRILGDGPRRTRCVTFHHRLDIPDPDPNHRSRDRPERLTAPRCRARRPSLGRGAAVVSPTPEDQGLFRKTARSRMASTAAAGRSRKSPRSSTETNVPPEAQNSATRAARSSDMPGRPASVAALAWLTSIRP